MRMASPGLQRSDLSDIRAAMAHGTKRRIFSEPTGSNDAAHKVDPKRLPSGVPSLEHWSHCCLEFGRYELDSARWAVMWGACWIYVARPSVPCEVGQEPSEQVPKNRDSLTRWLSSSCMMR